MTEAPERIWIDLKYLDSPSKTLACNLGTADCTRALASDTQYVRHDIHEAVKAERDALKAERDELLAFIKPFAKAETAFEKVGQLFGVDSSDDTLVTGVKVTRGNLRSARSLIERIKGKEGV